MSLKAFAILFGIVLVVAGLLGFFPYFAPDNLLFGYFLVDPMHNLIHIITGIIAFFVAVNTQYAKWFFRVVGIIYAIITVFGFVTHDLYIMHVNMADNLLHLLITIVALYVGFSKKIV